MDGCGGKIRCLTIKSVLAILRFDWMVRRGASAYEGADRSLPSADNPFTPALTERMGARIYKRYPVYGNAVPRLR